MPTENGEWGQLGRLAGRALAADGSLLLADDANGIIYRISYRGDQQTAAEDAGPDQPTNVAGADVRVAPASGPKSAPERAPQELASSVVGATQGSVEVSSAEFSGGAPIPEVYAAEQQNISPPLDWTDGPPGT